MNDSFDTMMGKPFETIDELTEQARQLKAQNPTNPDFFAHWSKENLIGECVRLNQVLAECQISLGDALEILTAENGIR